MVCMYRVHTAMTSRVHSYLPADLDNYYPYVLSGSFFPDSFYTCGSSEASEAIHWPPFLQKAVQFYRSKYQRHGDTEDARRLRAFLYGVLTHQIVDSSWHSIGMEEGLLVYLANADFAGDVERAHQLLDTAGDFMLMRRFMDRSLFTMDWEYPNWDDIKGILELMDISLPKEMIKYCTMRGESALKAEEKIVDTTATVYTRISPLLDDILESYHIGGLQETTDTAIRCIPELDDWFEHGAPLDPWLLCGAIPRPQAIGKTLKGDGTIISTYSPMSKFGHALAIGNFLEEPSLAISALIEDGVGSVYVLPLSDFTDVETYNLNSPVFLRGMSSGTNNTFQYQKRFGQALAPYNVLDITYLLVSEPGTSSVHIFKGANLILTFHDFQASSQFGYGGKNQQGISLHTWDLNNDGIQEIFITAPLNDVNGSHVQGEVIVLDGAKVLQMLVISPGYEIIDMQFVISKRITLPKKYVQNGYEQFGSSLAISADSIFVGVQGFGAVMVFDHEFQFQYSFQGESVKNNAYGLKVSSETGLYASEWILHGEWEDVQYVIVGAHREDFNGIQNCISCGAVYVYVIKERPIFCTKLHLEPLAANSFAQFGTGAVINNGTLYVSSQGYKDNSGKLFSVSMNQVLKSPSELLIKTPVVDGAYGYNGFGKQLVIHEDQIIIGESLFGYDELWDDTKRLMGRVGIYTLR